MSDTADDYKAMADHKRSLRTKYGIECPSCKTARPKAHATILIPHQRCNVDGYIDQRPYLTRAQWEAA